ncbi:hypothetical protein BDZ91DRAFT_775469 [Kalaharituber pfeilii]|nr:hypothetical protein BDZ91DRAFT_775469 [Kalaharituber pfeilii]
MENKIEILIHFAQVHETFRKPEIKALAELGGSQVQFTDYALNSPFALATIQDKHHAVQLSRAILVHSNFKKRLPALWKAAYSTNSFKFDVECYQGKRSYAEQREPINSFFYLNLMGPYSCSVIDRYDVKKRHYIGNTMMGAELSLITVNFAHVSPGKLMYEPFSGTSVLSNFEKYGVLPGFEDTFISDVTNTPMRECPGVNRRVCDAIICDPPYGVREGFKALVRCQLVSSIHATCITLNSRPMHTTRLYPSLNFAATNLVAGGRLCMWMPTANEDLSPLALPQHPQMELKAVCVCKRLISETLNEGEHEVHNGAQEQSSIEKPKHYLLVLFL